MATADFPLHIGAADLPDNSANNAPPGIVRVKSSAAAPTPFFLQALFDAATDEMLMWKTVMPTNYASSPVMKVRYKMASATSGAVRFEGRVAAITPGDSEDMDAIAFDTTNSNGGTVPGTAGHVAEISITLTNADSLAAGDEVIFYLRRDADGTTGTDDAAGDAEVVGVKIEYTTT